MAKRLFLTRFDWKYGITDFYEFVKMVIKKNFDYELKLEYQNHYSNRATISSEHFLSTFKNQLNGEGFDYNFKEDGSDQIST